MINFGIIFLTPAQNIYSVKIAQQNPFIKTWWEPEIVIFSKLQAVKTLSYDYITLCLIL